MAVAQAAPALNVVIANETAPSGDTVQIKFSLDKPAALYSGELALNLDPTVFGPVTAIATFSAAGNGSGFATVKGSHLDIHFQSALGTLGSAAMPITPDMLPGPFSVSVITDSGGNWLWATPLSGTTPVQLNIAATPGNLAPGTYAGVVKVARSGGNTFLIESTLTVPGVVQFYLPPGSTRCSLSDPANHRRARRRFPYR